MAAKALNFKMEESDIIEMKKVASVFHMTVTDVVKEAVSEYLAKMKRDPFYRITANVADASADESAEILRAIEELSDDDLSVVSVRRFNV